MSDVYKIGVEIALAGSIESALGALGKKFLGLQGDVDKIGQGIRGWGDAIKGVAAVAAGTAIFAGLKDLIGHGSELVHVQQQLAATGISQADAAKAQAEAWKISAKYGLEVKEVLGDIKEAQMVFGSTGHAIDFIDPLEKMRVVLNGVSSGSGNSALDAVYEMARAGELKGLQNPADFMQYFDGMTKAITASGGKVGPREFLQATQYGKIASKGWDEEFYTKFFPSMIQELGPSTAGQSLMSLYGTLEQGKVTKRSLAMMQQAGLIGDASKIIYDGKGDPVGFHPGAVVNSDGFTKDPFLWAQNTLKPLIEKAIGHDVKPGDKGALDLLAGMFGNRNSASAISSLLLEGTRINKDAGLIGRASGLNGADDFLQHDPSTVFNKFKNSWDNMLTSLGAPMVEPALKGLNAIAAGVNGLTGVFAAHPDAVKHMGEATAGLGAFLTIWGGAKLGKAAYSLFSGGPLIASAAALDGAAAALTSAAVALGAKGVIPGSLSGGIDSLTGGIGLNAAANPASSSWLSRMIGGAGAFFGAGLAQAYMSSQTPDKFAINRQGMYQFRQFGGQAGYGPMNGPHGPSPANIQVNPHITATQQIYLDARKIAEAVAPLIIKSISSMVAHPVSAPMSGGGGSYVPAADGPFIAD